MYRWWESIRNEEREAMMLSEEDRQTYMPDLMSEPVASALTRQLAPLDHCTKDSELSQADFVHA